MQMFTDEEREQILAESRAHLEELANLRVKHRDPMAEDAMERWRRGQPKAEGFPRGVENPTSREIEALRAKDWTGFVDARIEAALKVHEKRIKAVIKKRNKFLRELFRQSLGIVRKQMDDKITAEVGRIQKAHGTRDTAEVIDLPTPPIRSRHVV